MCLLASLLLAAASVFRSRRAPPTSQESPRAVSASERACGRLLLAYALHYLPYFLLGRQLYVHHYYPALYFNCLLSGAVVDIFISRIRSSSSHVKVECRVDIIKKNVWVPSVDIYSPLSDLCCPSNLPITVQGVCVLAVAGLLYCGGLVTTFLHFSPTVYGMEGGKENYAKLPNSSYHHLHWVSSWDL